MDDLDECTEDAGTLAEILLKWYLRYLLSLHSCCTFSGSLKTISTKFSTRLDVLN
jgi:hypothetical protein